MFFCTRLKSIFSSFCTYEKLSLCFLRHVTGFVQMGQFIVFSLGMGFHCMITVYAAIAAARLLFDTDIFDCE